MLEDPHPTVRATAIHGVCRITGIFWELIPAHIIKMFVTKLVGCSYSVPYHQNLFLLVIGSHLYQLSIYSVHMYMYLDMAHAAPVGGGGDSPKKMTVVLVVPFRG